VGGSGNDAVITVNAPPCVTPSTVYVDDDWVGTTPGTDPDGGGPAMNFGCDSFATIQAAVNAVPAGGTIIVAAGNYIENPSVNKSVSIRGANFGVAGAGVRGPESIVRTNGNQVAVFGVTAANVTIDGFTIDGDDPGITGIALASGDDTNSSYGVRPTTAAVNNLNVSNNIIKKVEIGLRGDVASQGNVVNQNWFDSIGHFDFGYCVSIRNNFYANVTNNKMTRAWTGVHINNHNGAGGPANFNITGNEIHSYAGGILYWLQYNGATGATISNNQMTAEAGAVANNFGVLMVSIQNAVNPTFTSNTVTGHNYGVGLFNVPTSSTITLGATNSISNSSLAGVFLTDNLNFNPIGLTNFLAGGPGAASTVNVTGMSITGNASDGLKIEGTTNTQNLIASGNTITGSSGTNGARLIGPKATANLTSNNITGFGTGLAFDNSSATTQSMSGSFNRIIGTTNAFTSTGGGSFSHSVENNWWGCNGGPGTAGCGAFSGASVDYDPWIVLGVSASPNPIPPGGNSTVTADMTFNSNAVSPPGVTTLPLPSASFTATNGTIAPPTNSFTAGQSQATFTSTSSSTGSACATVDNQQTCVNLNITLPSFSIDDVTLAEGTGPGTTAFVFTVTKTGTTAFNASVNFNTFDGTAQDDNPVTEDNDYTATSGTLVFGPSDTTQQITVQVNKDGGVESDEDFTVQLSGASGATISDGSGLGTIQNDDVCGLQSTVYVDDSWVGTPLGTDPDGGGPATNFGCDSFDTIQGGINGVAVGGTVIINAGTYNEDVNANKNGISLLGAGAGSVNVIGPIGGPGTTLQITASNVTVAGMTITRAGNNTTDWNNPGLNTAGIAIQGTSITGALIRDNVLTGNRTGIDINNSNGHTVRNNVIDFNRTGMIFRNQTDQMTVIENFITNNWTVGVLFLDASGGSNVPVQQATGGAFSNNNLSGNWYGQIVDRQSGGSLPAPGTTNLKYFQGDWFGTTTPVVTTANSAEPGYAAQIPVLYGGSATPPGGQPDIAGPASANFQYQQFLNSGTDTNVETTPGRGTNGFQGVANVVVVRSSQLHGWAQQHSTCGAPGTGSQAFVVGPGTPPIGEGSLQYLIGANGDSFETVRSADFNNVRVDALTSLAYGTYVVQDGSGGQAPYLLLNIDHNGDNVLDDQIFFEPVYQGPTFFPSNPQGPLAVGVWQNWDALHGGWWSLNSIAGATPGAGVKSLTQYLAAQPNSRVLNTGTGTGGFRVATGCGAPAWNNFIGDADDLFVGVSTTNIRYDFEPLPRISINDVTQAETNAGTTTFTFNVTLSGPSDQIITVDYVTADNSATAPSDYTSIPTTGLTFNPGETSKPVNVTVNGDTTFEANETFFVNLSNVNANATILDGQGVGTIQNDDLVAIDALDGRAAEPPSGTSQLLFTVALSAPAPSAISVNYATADGGATPAMGGAVCGGAVDYESTSGSLNFAAGERLKTVAVNICADGASEPDETFLLNLSGASGGVISDSQAVGTITQNNNAGAFLISELRTSGPNGAGDDYVELYNNTDTPLTVGASDASAGYGLFKKGTDCNATPVLIGTIPNGTVIPARGHYLFVGSAYSLGSYASGDQTLTADIESDSNVAIFSTADVGNLSTTSRLDAVGFGANTGGGVCDLLREGTNLPPVSGSITEHSFFRKLCDFTPGIGCTTAGTPKDTNNNSADLMFADTAGTFISGVPQRLGAPGPENLGAPLKRDLTINVGLLDTTVVQSSPPNRVRDFTSNPGNNSTFGTLSVRRRVVNNTGGSVTRLRYRIVELTTFPSPGGGVADLRALTSGDTVVNNVNDPNTCFASNGSATTPCTVTVRGTTLEQPPNQPNGGGYNATMASGTITVGTPLLAGESINVNFLLGIQTTGTFRFLIIVEALP
jgi:hypothetical protein